MKVLLLGGPKFLGRAVIEAALARGDEVTLFNRGQTNPADFPEVERLTGDRDGGLAPLAGHVGLAAEREAELLRDWHERAYPTPALKRAPQARL